MTNPSRIGFLIFGIIFAAVTVDLSAAEKSTERDKVRSAVRKSLTLLEKASAGSAKQRKCFTCHNQALPVFAIVEAKRRGFKIDEKNLKLQVKHTADHLKRGKANYLKGRGQGGRASTAGHAMWALEVGAWKADESTSAVVDYLLQYRIKTNHWPHTSNRPPSGKSHFSATYMALRGIAAYGGEEKQEKIAARKKQALAWALKAKARETEDQVFRLLTLKFLKASEDAISDAAKQLTAGQRKDGGWAQKKEMESDPYATGSALFALQSTGQLKTDSDVWQRGVRYLLTTQQKDGSWEVKSRSKPFQTYYETGYPHGKDQFISIAAGCWATMALLREFPVTESSSTAKETSNRDQ